MNKKLLIVSLLFACMGLLTVKRVSAGIVNSPHDVLAWINTDTSSAKAGICAYCHIPHSAKGDRLFPEIDSGSKGKYGTVASLCAKCHQNQTYLSIPYAFVINEIYRSLDSTNAQSNTVMDTHPVRHTNNLSQQWSLQNTSLETAFLLDWPWTSTWSEPNSKGTADIECTTCHNVHDWNVRAFGTTNAIVGGGAKRKFLRAAIYNPLAPAGQPRNFCAYCHQNRENALLSNTTGTHPVANGGYGSALNETTAASFNDWGGLAVNGLYLDSSYMIRPFMNDTDLLDSSSSREGRAIWDSSGYGNFIGARVYNGNSIDILPYGNEIICQSCHMPHGVMHSNDDVYGPDTGNGSDTAELRIGPLLAINNANNFGRTKPTNGPTLAQYPAHVETVYVIDTASTSKDENLLCEWCHGMTPDLANNRTDTSAFAHPVNAYPTIGADLGTSDNKPSDFAEYGTLWLKYPIRSWLKYRESSGIRLAANEQKNPSQAANPDLAPGARGTGNFLVCLSCHEAHQAQKVSPILKFGSETSAADAAGDTTFCDGCHYDTAMGTGGLDTAFFSDWTTHPSGVNATLITGDAEDVGLSIKLPNRAGLRTFKTGTAEYISCWTCHKAHKGVEKPLLADYQWPFSQICVNCHTQGDSDTARVSAGSKDARWAYGTTGADSTNANPSIYYMEGAVGGEDASGKWWKDNTSNNPVRHDFGDTARLGSHYIGQYSGGSAYPRPVLSSAANRGWLGERDTTRSDDNGTVKLTELDHRPGTPLVTGEELKDKWLIQQMADGTYDTFMVFETMTWYGSGQKSHIGTTDVLLSNRRYIICQSCHAVHRTAVGVADNENISRLLLAPNLDSYMCKRCHIPEADTTLTHPMSADTSGAVYNTANIFTGQQNFKYNTLVTRTGREVDFISGKFAYAYTTVVAPANYPDPQYGMSQEDSTGRRMNCDACHTVHNADSRMGAMILEGNNSTYTGIQPPYWNKVPRKSERKSRKTCDLCHMQGKI